MNNQNNTSGITNAASIFQSIPDASELERLAKAKDTQAHARLMAIVSDMLALQLNPHESCLITEILIHLIEKVDLSIRRDLSERLSQAPNAPLEVVLFLVNSDLDVATPLLKFSKSLREMDLAKMIKDKDSEYWQLIATRDDLTTGLVTMLSETRDYGTALVLSDNDNAPYTDRCYSIFSEMSENMEDLAAKLLKRTDCPRGLVERLYNMVGTAIKQDLKEKYPERFKHFSIEKAVDHVVQSNKDPSYWQASDSFEAQINVPHLLDDLKRNEKDAFMARFAKMTALNNTTIQKVIENSCGRALAILCRGTYIRRDEFIQLFMATRKFRLEEEKNYYQYLQTALNTYDRLTVNAASRLLRNSRQGIQPDFLTLANNWNQA